MLPSDAFSNIQLIFQTPYIPLRVYGSVPFRSLGVVKLSRVFTFMIRCINSKLKVAGISSPPANGVDVSGGYKGLSQRII